MAPLSPGPCGKDPVPPGTGAATVVPPPPYSIVVGAVGSVVGVELVFSVDDWIAVPFPPEVDVTVELPF